MRAVVVVLLLALALASAPHALASVCARTSVGLTPLTDLGTGTYGGFEGGLYPEGANERPATHTALGLALANAVVPRSPLGAPDPAGGRIVFLSIGMSNTRGEFARFLPLSAADPLRHPRVLAVNGAVGGQTASAISDPNAPYWTQVDTILAQAGAAPAQVAAVWLKEANAGPTGGFPGAAVSLERDLAAIVTILKVRFPNLHLVYLSSRIYAGYASTGLNPEPYAYESAFSVKWLVESQLDGTFPLVNPGRGVVAPWLSWGPYLWADGLTPRADGLTWLCTDFAADGTHPSASGADKVARMILDFVRTDATARAWYVDGGAAA